MKISIVTPCFDRSEYLNETIESIVSQAGEFEIEYIIQNGGRNHEVNAILEKWDEIIKAKKYSIRCNSLSFQYYNEQDDGMYDAVNKGFHKSTGDIMAWLNSDDVYFPHAFSTVTTVFRQFKDVLWITGVTSLINKKGEIIYNSYYEPLAYSRDFIIKGLYHIHNKNIGLNWIQQEPTFWKRELWEKAGGKVNSMLNFAADYHLWKNMAHYSDLVKVYSPIGAFRRHGEQKTSNALETYVEETEKKNEVPRGFITLRKILQNYPFLRECIFRKKIGEFLLRYLKLEKGWLFGRVVRWDFVNNKWIIFLGRIV
jgi:glycosyltransferase involved in cell wall biosynthesis